MADASHAPSALPYGAPDDFGYFERKPSPVGSAAPADVAPADVAPTASPWPVRRKWIKRGVQASIVLLALIIVWLIVTAPLSKSLEPIAPPRLTLVTADGQPIARNGAIIDKPVKAADLPPHVAQAFLAIEDRRFYTHWGVDPRGLARAALNNLGSGGTQGGSTITQQLAKITFLTPERSMTRKARELLISFWMEIWLTKDQILERYLSNVYFGDNVYGLRAASMHYFYRQPEKLTVAQSAMLAGLVQAPSRLAPTKNLKAAEKRMRMVLTAMVATGDLTEATAKATRVPKLDVRRRTEIPTGTYFADWAMPAARAAVAATYGEQRVTTALDSRLQNIARRVVNGAPLGKAQVALVAMRPNGEVVAMIGGKSYKASTFNRATQARRQPGSTFKLFVYYAALRAGMTPETLIDDTPITQGSYRPKNSGERYRGAISLKEAFAQSSNVAAVRLYRQLGDEAIIKAARDLGIRSPLSADPSLARIDLGLCGRCGGRVSRPPPALADCRTGADGSYFRWPHRFEQPE
jgi:penicillin-binding protein 1A